VTTVSLAGGRGSIERGDLDRLLVGLGLATSIQFYTFDSINLILPDMAGSFGASRDEASWILVSFSAALFFGTPVASYLARRVGMLRYIIGSVVVFVAASIAASLSTQLSQMLVLRAVEGFAGAGLNFWWRGVVYVFLVGPARGKAMTRIGTMLFGAIATGLLVSGFLTDRLSWRFVCVLDVAFAIGAIVLLLRYYPRGVAPPERGLAADGLGVAFLGVSLVSLQIILSRGEIDGWLGSPHILALALASGIGLILFLVRELDPGNPRPLLRLALLRDRNVVAAVLIGLLTGVILSGALYALPQYLRDIDPQRRSASQTGVLLCVYALTGGVIVRPLASKAVVRFGQRKVAAFALICFIAAMLLLAWLLTSNTPAYYYVPSLVLYGVCLSLLLPAVGSGTAARVAMEAQIDAVTIYMTVRQFGTAVGVALVNVVIDQRQSLHSTRLFSHLELGGAGLDRWLRLSADQAVARFGDTVVDAHGTALGLLHRTAVRQASTLAFADVFRAMACVGVLALLLVPVMSPTPGRKT
jgi:DHA2 family multidrug resistance protein